MRPLIALTSEAIHLPARQSPRGAYCGVAYSEAIEMAGGVPFILPLTREPAILRQLLDQCAGLLLIGGGDVSHKFYAPRMMARQRATFRSVDEIRDEMEIFLTHEALRRELPVLGICRGMQVMNVALGGTLVPDLPGHRRDHPVRWDATSQIFTAVGAPATPVNSSHHQALDRVADELRVTAWAPDRVIEAVEHRSGKFFCGVQFHPERLLQSAPRFRRLFAALVRAQKTDCAAVPRRRSSTGRGRDKSPCPPASQTNFPGSSATPPGNPPARPPSNRQTARHR